MKYIGIQAHTLTLAILLATFCAFEWRSNLKIEIKKVKNFDQYLWDSEQWHFHFKMNIEGWDSEVTLWHHRPPDQCQKYFFLGNFHWSFRIFGQN